MPARATGRTLESAGFWAQDAAGTESVFAGLNLTARDFVKIGGLIRNSGGRPWAGGHTFDFGYGYLWRLPEEDRGELSAIGARACCESPSVAGGHPVVRPEGGRAAAMGVPPRARVRAWGSVPGVERQTGLSQHALARGTESEEESDNRENETIAFLRAVAGRGD